MRREVVARRLPFAVLGTLLALVVAAALPSTGPGPAIGASHASVGSGHLTDSLLAAAHVRTASHLPAAVPGGTPSTGAGPAAPASATASPPLRPLTATPPTAIRGPPA